MKSNRIVLLIAILLLLASHCWATPNPTGVSGTFTQGQTITITGSDFGVKSPAGPVDFWDFHEGTNGAAITARTNYAMSGSPTYSTEQLYPGTTMSGKGERYKYQFATPPHSDMYITYNSYKVYTGPGPTTKWCRFSGPLSGGQLGPELILSVAGGWRTVTTLNRAGGNPSSPVSVYYDNGSWSRDEFIFNTGTEGQSDGWWKYLDHKIGTSITQYSQSNLPWRTTADDIQQLSFGTELQNGDTHYIGNLYFDITQARLEIGDNATWANCTHREIQVPATWSASSITAPLNVGSFAGGATVYVFVVGADGVPNTTGHPITLGASQQGGGASTPVGNASGQFSVR